MEPTRRYVGPMSHPSKSPADTIAIPEGFASLDDAARWEGGLRKAEEALDCLWAQRWIYAAEALLALPGVSRIQAAPSRSGGGAEVGVLALWRGERVELDVLLARLFRSQYEGVGLVESGRALESLMEAARELERWTRERPSMLRCLPKLAGGRWNDPVSFDAGASWSEVADALGAVRASAGMERAQLAQESKGGQGSQRSAL